MHHNTVKIPINFGLARTPDLRIFLAEKMRMGVFGQERGEISAFLYGKKCGKKCGGNAEKMRMGVFGQERGEISAFLYGKKCGGNAEKMRMGVFGQEYGEISALYPHFSHNAEITRRIFPHSQFSASNHNAENNMENNAEMDGGTDKVKPVYPPSTPLSGGYNNMIKTRPLSVTIWRTGIQWNNGLNSDGMNEDAKISFHAANVIWITLLLHMTTHCSTFKRGKMGIIIL